MLSNKFEGWYFKHQKGDDTVAIIVGSAASGAFIQLLFDGGARQYDLPSLTVSDGVIVAGNCCFSRQGCHIDLPGVRGDIAYGKTLELRSDIMGFFRFLPMQCSHGVLSMSHTLRGSLTIEGVTHNFNGGRGYIEKDSGCSFPQSYLWLQCNDFPIPLSVMVAIAHIPFAVTSFSGCICAVMVGRREYRFATYCGVKIHAAGPHHIRLSQGKLLLELDVKPANDGHPLRSPVQGSMSGRVRESVNAAVHLRLWDGGSLVANCRSTHAVYEFVPGDKG